MIIKYEQLQAQYNYWKQERIVVFSNTISRLAIWTDQFGSLSNPMAIYTADDNGEIYADISDYVRTYGNSHTLYLWDTDGGDPPEVFQINLDMAGLINPASVLIPSHPLESTGAVIVPPSMLLQCPQGYGEAELYLTTGSWSVSGDAVLALDKRSVAFDGDFTLTHSTGSQAYKTIEPRCDVEYALVRWQSFTGRKREHLFEVVKQRTDAADTIALMPLMSEYVEIKGRVDGFTLRLDRLNRYDLWYYADIITSSKVEVSLDNGQTYDRVQVTTKTITLPDGEARTDGKLEIQVNWKHYDAVDM